MTAALLRIVRRVANQFGPHAADALVRAIRAWAVDPSNAEARARLSGALSDIAQRAGGVTARLSVAAAAGLERYRRSVGSWERDVMAARYEIPQHPAGDVRAAAVATYLALTEAAPRLITDASRPDRALREVAAALECEARMLATEALGPGERQLALQANAEARTACMRLGVVGSPRDTFSGGTGA